MRVKVALVGDHERHVEQDIDIASKSFLRLKSTDSKEEQNKLWRSLADMNDQGKVISDGTIGNLVLPDRMV